VEDDGVGFNASEASGPDNVSSEASRVDNVASEVSRDSIARGDNLRSFGLLGMRERAALVGATIQIESAAGRGTTVLVRAAVKPSATRHA
jgi:glucose-6-phosphate-specific signal transduction histidine kinase